MDKAGDDKTDCYRLIQDIKSKLELGEMFLACKDHGIDCPKVQEFFKKEMFQEKQ